MNSTNTTTATTTDIPIPPVTPEHILWYFRLIVFGILGQIMAIFGVFTNSINTVIFIKLGFKDPTNVSLLGLSISDLISCFTVTFINLCMTPGFTERDDLPFTPIGTHYLFSSWPHLIFVKVTCCITAAITIERCLCVKYPLRIKQMVTTKRQCFITVGMYVFILGLTSPIYYLYRMEWVFFPDKNRSIYTLTFSDDRPQIEPPFFIAFGVVLPFVLFFIIIISTIILVHSLKKNAKWRRRVTGTGIATSSTTTTTSKAANGAVTSRDTKVAKMVLIISVLFISCNAPVMISCFALVSVPELKEGGAYQNTLYVIFSINYFLESTNASFNIVIYYVMSSNYKAMFDAIFLKGSKMAAGNKRVVDTTRSASAAGGVQNDNSTKSTCADVQEE